MLTTKYNYSPVRPRHWQTYGGFASVPVIINMSTPARERFLRRLDLLLSLSSKSLGNKNTVTVSPLSLSKVDCHGNKFEMCLFPSCLTFIAVWWVSGLHTVRTFIKQTCQKTVNYDLSYIYGCTYIWLHNILDRYTRR